MPASASHGSSRARSGAAAGPAEKRSSQPPVASAPDAARTFEQLETEFNAAPSRGALLKLVSHEYFVRGAITSPAARILENGELLADVSASERRILDNILGQHALLQSGITCLPDSLTPGTSLSAAG